MSPLDFRGTDRFEVRGRLGAGGFGVVYEAFDRERDAVVALKTLRNVTPEALYRLKREFRSLADITHPNLVQLYELMSVDQEWFFTMERLDGRPFLEFIWGGKTPHAGSRTEESRESLEISDADLTTSTTPTPATRVIRGRPTPVMPERPPASGTSTLPTPADLSKLTRSLRQLAQGLTALHRARSIHRDIKPSNVLVTREGRVVLLDFGLVADFGAEALGHSLEIIGTPVYMSPEQAAGLPLSPASDWYSVGVMLFHGLTGRPPIAGSAMEVLQRKQHEEPALPSGFVTGVPAMLDELCRDLLHPDQQRRPTGDDILRRLDAVAVVPPDVSPSRDPSRATFVGRSRALGSLRSAFDQTRDGTPVTVCLHGPSGIGKTSLVRAFLSGLREEYPETVVLAGRCFERESVPYKGVDSLVDSLTRHLKHLEPPTIEALMPRHVDALSQLFPVLRQFDPYLTGRRRIPNAPDSQELRRRGFGALRELLLRLTDTSPVVIVIDDLQWGDGDSADLLTEVLRGPDAPPLLFIASYRGDEVKSSPFLRGFLTPATLAHLRVTDLVVDQLSPDESRELARVLLLATAPRLVEIAPAIAAEAAGSPFFIDELVRAAEAAADRRAPDRAPIEGDGLDTAAREATLAQMIQVRLARLPAEAQRVLQLIAVNGQPIPAPVLRTAAGAGVWERSSVVLTAHHLIRTRETGRSSANDEVETYHDRIRETVVRALDPALLRQHHQALALAFEAAQADAELLADHFLAVGDDPRAASYALQAAETAERSLAFDRAARLYQRVVGLLGDGSPQIGGVYERLGGALVNAGRGRDAANAYFAAARCDPGRARDTKGKAAQQLLFSGHIDEGLAALNEVLASIDMRLPETRMGTMAALLWGRFRLRLRGLRFTERPEHAVDAEAINRIDICFSVAMGLAVVDTVRGIVFQTRQLLLALDAGEKHRVVRAVIWEAGFTASRGSRTRARTQKLMDLSARLAADVDTPYARALLSTCIGIAAYLNGEWKKSIKFTLEAADMLRGQCTGVAHDINNANFFALWSQFWVGDFRAIRTRYPVLLKDALERGDRYAETMYLVFLSHYYYLAADEPELARRTSHEAMRNWSQAGFHIQHCWEMWAQIEIALYEGRGSLAWLTANRVWAELEHSLLLRIQQMTICMVDLKGRAAIAAASDASSAGERRRLLRIAARAASRMDRQRTAWGSALAGFLRTGIAAVQGDAASVQRGLERSAQAFDRLDMALVATVARRRLGELTDRADLVAASDLWMREQGIGHPERMARMLAPWTIARRSGTAAAVSPAI